MRAKAFSIWGISPSRIPLQRASSNGFLVESVRSIHSTQPSQQRQRVRKYRYILPRAHPQPPPPPAHLDRTRVVNPRHERQLLRSRVFPVGSRRLRAAIRTGDNIPFELLPYQCFQEALKVIHKDREEKVKAIEVERARMERLKLTSPGNEAEEARKQHRLRSMTTHMEKMKILADINDPLVKKRFEDGFGDMDRPIYRHLAEKKWRVRKQLILEQRVNQMKLIPDILPTINITADIDIHFFGRKHRTLKMVMPRATTRGHTVIAQPGEFVASKVTQGPPQLNIQVFNKGTRHVTIAIVDPDVPNLETDSFDDRCHFLAANVPISPTSSKVRLSQLNRDDQVIIPWVPPYSIKDAPYHRLGIFVMEQRDGVSVNTKEAAQKEVRDGFKLRGFVTRHSLTPITATLFRTQWDTWMDEVMKTHGFEGANLQFQRKKVEPLPYKRKDPARFR